MPALVLTLLLAAPAWPAWADAIDGKWCHNNGRRFTIRGPHIVNPGGKATDGNYGRHDFSYTGPAPQRGAGGVVAMVLMNENTVQLRCGDAADGKPEI